LNSSESFRARLWKAWPWVNWLLFPALLGLRWLDRAGIGYLMLFVTVVSPVILVMFGLLGSLPRLMLRRGAGRASVPLGVTRWLLVHWGAALLFALTAPDLGYWDDLTTVIMSGLGVGFDASVIIAWAMALVGCAAWIAQVVLTSRATRAHAGTARASAPAHAPLSDGAREV